MKGKVRISVEDLCRYLDDRKEDGDEFLGAVLLSMDRDGGDFITFGDGLYFESLSLDNLDKGFSFIHMGDSMFRMSFGPVMDAWIFDPEPDTLFNREKVVLQCGDKDIDGDEYKLTVSLRWKVGAQPDTI